MTDDKLLMVFPELGYGIARMSECYQLYRWREAGIATTGRAAGNKVEAKWVAVEKYPRTLEHAVRLIRDLAITDQLDNADAKATLKVIERIIQILSDGS